MALIICPDCKKEISDRAKTCIFCGCPIEQLKNEVIEDAKVEVPSTETFIGESEAAFSEDSVLFLVNNYYVDMAKMTAAYPDPNELADHLLKNTRCVRKTAVKIMEDYTNGNYNHNKRIAKKYKDLKKNRWEKPKRQGHPFKKFLLCLLLAFLVYYFFYLKGTPRGLIRTIMRELGYLKDFIMDVYLGIFKKIKL